MTANSKEIHMCIEVPNHADFKSFCRFRIKKNDFPSNSIFTWMLLGYFDYKLTRYNFIADSNNELELHVWADMHGLKIEN